MQDTAFIAELLTLPSEAYLGDQVGVIDVDAIHYGRKSLRQAIAKQLQQEFLTIYQSIDESVGGRRLKNVCLSYLMLLSDQKIHALCLQQFNHANNMTDAISALGLLVNSENVEREQVLSTFYQKWQHDRLVIDKWFSVQAASEMPGTLQQIKKLLQHPAFDIKNPNKVLTFILLPEHCWVFFCFQ
jgi:aminopeptidase N